MGGLVSLIIFIVVMYLFASVAKMQKKQQNNARTQQRPGSGAGKSAPNWAYQEGEDGAFSWKNIQQVLEQYAENPAAAPQPVAAPEPMQMELGEGESRVDGYDVGGSLPHDSHQGLEFEGHVHAARPAQMYHLAERAEPQPQALPAPSLGAQDMRRAIVMTELLARPVSLRRRYPR